MKYGTSLIVIGIFDFLCVFSGLPTGWKKAMIVTTSVLLVLMGWIVRTINRKRIQKTRHAAERIEPLMNDDMNRVAEEIARDVKHKVDHDIDLIVEEEAGFTE